MGGCRGAVMRLWQNPPATAGPSSAMPPRLLSPPAAAWVAPRTAAAAEDGRPLRPGPSGELSVVLRRGAYGARLLRATSRGTGRRDEEVQALLPQQVGATSSAGRTSSLLSLRGLWRGGCYALVLYLSGDLSSSVSRSNQRHRVLRDDPPSY